MFDTIIFSRSPNKIHIESQLPVSRLYSYDIDRWISLISRKDTKHAYKKEYETFISQAKILTPVQKLKERAISFSQSFSLRKVLSYIAGVSPWAIPLAYIAAVTIIATTTSSLGLIAFLLITYPVFLTALCVGALCASYLLISYGIKCKRRSNELDAISELVKSIEEFEHVNNDYNAEEILKLLKKMIDAESFGMDKLQYQKALHSLNHMLKLNDDLKKNILDLIEQEDFNKLTSKMNEFLDLNTAASAEDILYELINNETILDIFLTDPTNGATNFDNIVDLFQFYYHRQREEEGIPHQAIIELGIKMKKLAEEQNYEEREITLLRQTLTDTVRITLKKNNEALK